MELSTFSAASDESRAGMEMLIVTNREKLYGATIMLFPDILKPVSELLQQDLYIIPSSIHEILVLPHLVEEMFKALFGYHYGEVWKKVITGTCLIH